MPLPDLNKELSFFRIGGVILYPKPLHRNGFGLSHIRRPISPLKYKQGEIKTQNMKIVKAGPH